MSFYVDDAPGSNGDVWVAVEQTDLKPEVADVALLLRTRTVGTSQLSGGLGSDTGPVELTTFDETTRPTAVEVQNVIDAAYGSILGDVDGKIEDIPQAQYSAFRQAVALYAAVLIEVSFFRNDTNDDLLALWRDLSSGTDAGTIDSAFDLFTEELGGGQVVAWSETPGAAGA